MKKLTMKNFVIYTVLTGGYEDILQPLVVDERFDYILFTDICNVEKVGIWTVRNIPEDMGRDYIRLSRYPKAHPVRMLAGYVVSLYIDANIQIKDEWIYTRVCELYHNNIEYAGVRLVLTGRDCIYDHSFDMCRVNAEHDYVAIKQCHELYLKGFPSHFGLNENNIIYRKHTDLIRKVGEEWWYWITNFSRRDQFSFMYCLWKYKVQLNYILPDGEDSRNSKHFNFIVHNNNPVVSKRKWVKKGIFELIRYASLSQDTEKGLKIWANSYKSNHPVATLYILSYLSFFINLPSIFIKAKQKWLKKA